MLVLDETTIQETKVIIGDWCNQLRKNEGISQIDLAADLRISHKTIANLENGKNFTIETLLKVLKYFGEQEQLHKYFMKQLSDQIEKQHINFY